MGLAHVVGLPCGELGHRVGDRPNLTEQLLGVRLAEGRLDDLGRRVDRA